MAIADFFHCDNLPDTLAESPRFRRIINLARLVGSDFKCPNKKLIGGELLDINFKNCYERNKKDLLSEVSAFGFAWIGDGATVHRMPLINVLCTSGVTPPTVVGIYDCSEHLAGGGKKDASFIANLFEGYTKEFDKEKKNTDIFFFDGASNVQKAGEVLVAKYPRAMVLHGGEHVISLFFDDIARLVPIKVSPVRCAFITIVLFIHPHR